MVKTLILTHGGLAQELLKAAEIIVGDVSAFRAVTLDWHDSFEQARRKTQAALAEIASVDGVLILTDMYGGTPYNVAVSLVDPGKIGVVTGVNLPMVVRLACPGATDANVSELATWIQEKARLSICLAGEGNGKVNGSGVSDAECNDD